MRSNAGMVNRQGGRRLALRASLRPPQLTLWLGWLAWLAGLAGWLGWLAGWLGNEIRSFGKE